eukprot:scaffold188621_cov27-Tisochrysis_lutea.AAC.2
MRKTRRRSGGERRRRGRWRWGQTAGSLCPPDSKKRERSLVDQSEEWGGGERSSAKCSAWREWTREAWEEGERMGGSRGRGRRERETRERATRERESRDREKERGLARLSTSEPPHSPSFAPLTSTASLRPTSRPCSAILNASMCLKIKNGFCRCWRKGQGFI